MFIDVKIQGYRVTFSDLRRLSHEIKKRFSSAFQNASLNVGFLHIIDSRFSRLSVDCQFTAKIRLLQFFTDQFKPKRRLRIHIFGESMNR